MIEQFQSVYTYDMMHWQMYSVDFELMVVNDEEAVTIKSPLASMQLNPIVVCQLNDENYWEYTDDYCHYEIYLYNKDILLVDHIHLKFKKQANSI